MENYLLTLDAGTTGLKCSLFTFEGHAAASAVSEYGVDFPHPGWAQQSAEQFLLAAQQSVQAVMAQHPDARIAAIGLSGTMNGCIPLDDAGNALYPNIIHLDTRTEKQVARIASLFSDDEFYLRTGNRIDPHYSLPKILWLKDEEPDIYRKARWFVNTKDLLYGFLTGRFGFTDYSDAGLTCALNIETKSWDEPLLSALGVKSECMPQLLPSHHTEGTLTPEAARLLGLPSGIPVSIGGGDGACASHGAGLFEAGSAYMNIGSSAWIISLSDKPVLDSQRRIFCYPDLDGEHYDVCGTVQCGASALDWAVENLLAPGEQPGGKTFARLEQLAQQAPAGSHGVFFLPTLMGERTPWWDFNARGALIGATLSHTRADVVRSVYEGVAQELHLCDRVLRENGLTYDRLTLIGGGAKSSVWPQMIADLFGVSTCLHASARQATSLGAALAAGVGVGVYRDYADAAKVVHTLSECAPRPEVTASYVRHTELFESLYTRLRSAYHAIADYQRQF